jgi:hypothetical protein
MNMTKQRSGLHSHWEHGTWAPNERRLHWYLLPEAITPGRVVDTVKTRLSTVGLDVVPEPWLHCTVVSLLPSLATANTAELDQMVNTVELLTQTAAPIVASSTLRAHGSALVWDLAPGERFSPLFRGVASACGSMLRTDPNKVYQPHVTVAYVNIAHDEHATAELLGTEACDAQSITFGTLYLLDVFQRNACYQWEVVKAFTLCG